MEITLKNLQEVGIRQSLQNNVLTTVGPALPLYHIDTFLRIAHFMAQVCHESDGFTIDAESLSYTSPSRLMMVWPKRFTTIEFAQQYINNAKKLANYVYSNRMGNGGPETNDGYNFRGRGPMQTTGRENYARMSNKIFNDDRLLTNPDLLSDLQYGIKAALIEWKESNCNAMADTDDIHKVTVCINGGTTGLNERKIWLDKWKHSLRAKPV